MKIKNLMNFRTLVLLLIVSATTLFVSCKKDATIVPGDKTALTTLIAQADVISNAATSSDYPQTAIDTYKATLASIKTTAATTLTQAQIDNLVTSLNTAMSLFNSQAFGFIDNTQYLNAGWHFDEGTGTTATAYSTTKHVGTFKTGMTAWGVSGTTMPTWVAGVKGGNAIYLTGGAHLEVPFNPLFLPADLTISVWVKPDDVFSDDYIVSQNYWEGYKFQTQSTGRSFFTMLKTDGTIKDLDNGTSNSVAVGSWSHLVISLNSTTSTEKFYVNGTLLITYTSADGVGPLTRTPMHGPDGALVAGNLPFIIGAAATDADYVANNWTWLSGQLAYKGAIDELNIYNIALTDGQVSKLYNDEKP